MRSRTFGRTGRKGGEQPRLDPAVDEELNAFVSRRKAERPDQWR
jgi:trimethylamine:corrinoid methyltransferase-like protein